MNNHNLNFERYQTTNAYWNKYEQILAQMSNEQKVFVSKQESVLIAKQNLLSAFIDYLFEQNKVVFINSSENGKLLMEDYISTINTAAESYVSKSEQLEKENEELKKQIKQLMLDFKSTQKGTVENESKTTK